METKTKEISPLDLMVLVDALHDLRTLDNWNQKQEYHFNDLNICTEKPIDLLTNLYRKLIPEQV